MLGLGSMMVRVDRMYSNMVLYDVLLGFILMGLIIRLIMYLSFQKRLSVIGGTLVGGQLYANIIGGALVMSGQSGSCSGSGTDASLRCCAEQEFAKPTGTLPLPCTADNFHRPPLLLDFSTPQARLMQSSSAPHHSVTGASACRRLLSLPLLPPPSPPPSVHHQARLMPELFSFAIIVVITCCLLAVYACVCFGTRCAILC